MRLLSLSKFIALLFWGLLFPWNTHASNQEDKARMYFDNRQYHEALEIWHDLLRSGDVTSGVYYNLGLTHSKLGNSPQAMLAYEKSLRLKPSSKTIKKAMMDEKEKMVNAIIPVEPFFILEWYKSLLAFFRPGLWGVIGLLALTFAVMLYVRKFTTSTKLGLFSPSRNEMILSSVGLIFIVAGFLSYASLYRNDEAILHSVCEIRQAPSEASPLLHTLHPGEKIVILDQLTGWYNIRLLNIEEGWIRADCLTRIVMGTP
jgi:tetratricopeptide (TPR) repeat protein